MIVLAVLTGLVGTACDTPRDPAKRIDGEPAPLSSGADLRIGLGGGEAVVDATDTGRAGATSAGSFFFQNIIEGPAVDAPEVISLCLQESTATRLAIQVRGVKPVLVFGP